MRAVEDQSRPPLFHHERERGEKTKRSARRWIDTDAPVAIGFVEVLEHGGAFLLVEVRGVRARESVIQQVFDGELHL